MHRSFLLEYRCRGSQWLPLLALLFLTLIDTGRAIEPWQPVNIDGFGNGSVHRIGNQLHRSAADGKLYAATHNNTGDPRLLQSSDGTTWADVTPGILTSAAAYAVTAMESTADNGGYLWFGTQDNGSGDGKIFRGTGGSYILISGAGSGFPQNAFNTSITAMFLYDNDGAGANPPMLYVGTENLTTGAQLWRTVFNDGSYADASWTKVLDFSGSDGIDTNDAAYNNRISAIHAWNGRLYIGTGASIANGSEIYSSSSGDVNSWAASVGANNGFGVGTDEAKVVCFTEFNGALYAGTDNRGYPTGGCGLWRTQDGYGWLRVNEVGFGHGPDNPTISSLAVFQNRLYATISAPYSFLGGQVWSTTDGDTFSKSNYDGFTRDEFRIGDSTQLAVFAGSLYWFGSYAGVARVVDSAQLFRLQPPVSEWNFEEGTGLTVLDGIGTDNGSLKGATIRRVSPAPIGGGSGSVELTGGYIELPDDSTLSQLTTFTFSMWFCPSIYGAGVLVDSQSGNNGYRLSTDGDFVTISANGATATGTVGLTVGAWQHVAVVSTGSSATVYVNGRSDAALATTAISAPTSPAKSTIGAEIGGLAGQLKAVVDRVVLYDYALSAQDIVAQGGVHVPSAFSDITSAMADSGVLAGDTIVVAPGTYSENLTFSSQKALEIIGSKGAQETVIDGGGIANVVMFPSGSNALLRGLRLTGGSGNFSYPGGGVYTAGRGHLIDCTIDNNYSQAGGGGLYVTGSGQLTVDGCRVIGNSCDGGGGGIATGSGNTGTVLRVQNSLISGNLTFEIAQRNAAFDANGGGIYCGGAVDMRIENCQIIGNQAVALGGGIFSEFSANVTVAGSVISGNTAGSSGGGIYSAGDATLINNTITYNRADVAGGGLSISESDNSEVANNLLLFNTAPTDEQIVAVNGGDDPNWPLFHHNAVGGGFAPGFAVGSGNIGTVLPFLPELSGNWTANSSFSSATVQTTLFQSSNYMYPGSFTGKYVRSGNSPRLYLIADNTRTTITVWGNTSSTAIAAGSYTIIDLRLGYWDDVVVNGGSNAVPALTGTDLQGEPRIIGGTVDMGADEFRDSDSDTMPDWYEAANDLDVTTANGDGDSDGDGVFDHREYEYNSSPNSIHSTQPAALHVSTTGDDGGTGNASSPFRTIQKALDTAVNLDIIRIEAGTYSGVGNVNLNPNGKLVILLGNGVTIDGGGTARAFLIQSGETRLTHLLGFRFTNCRGADLAGEGTDGGAVLIRGASVTMTDCEFDNNSSPTDGGALSISDSNSLITGCQFRHNNAGGNGGAIAVTGNTTSGMFARCQFSGNTATGNGGGIFGGQGSTTRFDNAFIGGNTAVNGGGIANYGASLVFIHCTVKSNDAQDGGGLYTEAGAPVMRNSVVWGNTATTGRVGIYRATGSMVLSDSIAGGQGGSAVLDVDPRFDENSENGAELLPNSPAINYAYLSDSIPEDIRGHSRFGGPDAGAYEYAQVFVAPTGNDGAPGTASQPFATISRAIETAVEGQRITLQDGLYTGDGNRNLDFQGRNLTLRSENGPLSVTIDCNVAGFRAVNRIGGDHGLIFQTEEDTGTRIEGISFVGQSSGGGQHVVVGGYASPLFLNCRFSDALAVTDDGASVGIIEHASPRFENCTFGHNRALNNMGGAVMINGAYGDFIGCRFVANAAIRGGAVAIMNGNLRMENCVVSGNSSPSGDGGGLAIGPGATSQIAHCTLIYNHATNTGGGIWVDADGGLQVLNSFMAGNAAGFDPDIADESGAAFLAGSVLLGNGAVSGLLPGASGTWDSAPVYESDRDIKTFGDSTANFVPGELVGLMLAPVAIGNPPILYPIVANSATTISVISDTVSMGGSGDNYQVYDYHLLASAGAVSAGISTYAVDRDIDGAARSDGSPDAGADEVTAPAVVNVRALDSNGLYTTGTLTLEIELDQSVTVATGTTVPQLTLETGTTDAVADYISGSGTKKLQLSFTIVQGYFTNDLSYLAGGLTLNDSTAVSAAGVGLDAASLPSPGGARSLSANSDIQIDALPPAFVGVSIASDNGTAGLAKAGDTVTVTFVLDEAPDGKTATIDGQPADLTHIAGNTYEAVRVMQGGDSQGPVIFSITVVDNDGYSNTSTATTDTSTVSFDSIAPVATGAPTAAAGAAINAAEEGAGVVVQVSLAGTGAVSGDKLKLLLGGASFGTPVDRLLNGTDIGSGTVVLTLVTGQLGADGPKAITAVITDRAGNSSAPSSALSLTLDTQPPTLTAVSIASDNGNPAVAIVGDTVTVSFTADETIVPGTVTIAGVAADSVDDIGGDNWTATRQMQALDSAGLVPFEIFFADTAGNAGTPVTATLDTTDVNLDKSTETPTFTAPATATTYMAPVTVSYTLPENPAAGSVELVFTPSGPGAVVTLTLADSAGGTGVSFSFDPASPTAATEVTGATSGAIPDGTYTVALRYRDTAGNSTSQADHASVVIDTSTEAPTLNAPTAADAVRAPISIDFDLPEAPTAGTVELVFTSETTAYQNTLVLIGIGAGNHAFTINPADPAGATEVNTASQATLPDDTYTVAIRYQDAIGNTAASDAATGIIVDTVAPSQPGSPVLDAGSDSGFSDSDGITNSTSPSFHGTAEAFSTISLTSDVDGILDTTTADGNGDWAISTGTTFRSALTEGQHQLTVTAQDLAGNISAPSAGTVVVIDYSNPGAPTAAALTTETDHGQSDSDGITNTLTPDATGLADPDVDIIIETDADGGSVVGTGTADNTGVWIVALTLTEGSHNLTVTAIDAAGNASSPSVSALVTIDVTAPTIACPTDVSIQCAAAIPAVYANFAAFTGDGGSASDDSALDSSSFTHVDDVSDNGNNPEAITRTYNILDVAGNPASCAQLITINDITAPSISGCPTDITVAQDAGQCTAVVTYAAPTATDNCVGAITPALTAGFASGSAFPVGTTTVTYTATDAANNSSSCSFTVTVTDNTAPKITNCPPNETISNDPGRCDLEYFYTAPGVTDNCPDATISLTGGFASGSTFPLGATVVTYTAMDASGNSVTCSFTVTVLDDGEPEMLAPADIAVTCIGDVPAAYTDLPQFELAGGVATDNCTISAASFALQSEVSDNQSCPETITRTYQIEDAAGNVGICEQVITVNDTVLPVISGPAGTTIACIADLPAGLTDLAAFQGEAGYTASDNCGLNAGSFSVGDVTIGNTITRTYSIADNCGNAAMFVQVYTLNDPILPTIVCPDDIAADTQPGICGAVVTYLPPVPGDNCAGTTLAAPVSLPTAGLSSGSLFPLGTTTLVYTATDAFGNMASCSFTITVTDRQLPALTCPPDIEVSCPADVPAGYADLGAFEAAGGTTADNCAVAGASFILVSTVSDNGSCPETRTRTYQIQDSSGNIGTCQQRITIHDTEFPVISCPAGGPVTCLELIAAAFTDLAAFQNGVGNIVTDNCGLDADSFAHIGDVKNGNMITRTYSIADHCGNTSTHNQIFTLTDAVAPTVVCPANIIIGSTDPGICAAVVTFTEPVPTDNCAGATLSLVSSPTANLSSGSTFPLGTTTLVYTATDAFGNTASCSFTITVNDDDAPVFSNCPSDIVVAADAGVCTAVVTYTLPTATDNCDGAITPALSSGLASASTFPLGDTLVEYLAVDTAGNETYCSFTVTVEDHQAPALVCPGNTTEIVPLGATEAIIALPAAMATDNCLGAITITNTRTAGGANASDTYPLGLTVVTFTATDASGQVSTCTTNVLVTSEAPATIGDFVWQDLNGNGIQDEGEPGIEGAVVELIDSDDAVMASTTTSAAGAYSFTVGSGTYRLQFTAPAASLATTKLAGGNSAVNSDIDSSGRTDLFTISSGETMTDLDAGFVCDLTVGGIVWSDLDASGTYDSRFDMVFANIPIELWQDADSNGILEESEDALIDTGSTNVAGAYQFAGLLPGNYFVWIASTVFEDGAPLFQHAPLAGATDPNNDIRFDNNGFRYEGGITTDAITLTEAGEPDTEDGSTCTNLTVDLGFYLDTVKPTITCPSDLTVQCLGDVPAAAIEFADFEAAGGSATDNAGLDTLSFDLKSESSDGQTCPETITRVYEIKDAAGNSESCTQLIIVADTIAPAIVCPANTTITCIAELPDAIADFTAFQAAGGSATDNCGIDVGSFAFLGSVLAGHTITRTYEIADTCGNSVTCDQVFTLNDTTLPTVSCPANIIVDNDPGQCEAIVTFATATVADNCAGVSLTLSSSPTANRVSGSVFPIGTTTLTYTATDAYGNTASCSFTVTVEDSTAPTITCPSDISITVPAGSTSGDVTIPDPITGDNCFAAPLVTNDRTNSTANPSGSYPVGDTTVVFTARDGSGNESTCSILVTVVEEVVPAADLRLTRTLPSFPVSDSLFDIIYQVENLGPDTADGVDLLIQVPDDVVIDHVTASNGTTPTVTANDSLNDIQASASSLVANGQPLIVTVTASAATAGGRFILAGATSATLDLNGSNNSVSDELVISAGAGPADLAASITAPAAPTVDAAFTVTYSIQNTGGTAVQPATAQIVLPATAIVQQVTLPAGATQTTSSNASTITLSIANLTVAAGGTAAVVVQTRTDRTGAFNTSLTIPVAGYTDANAANNSTTAQFAVAAGAPTAIRFATQPVDGTVNSHFANSVIIEVIDQYGHLATNSGALTVSLTIGTDPNGGVTQLSGNGPVLFSSGSAHMDSLRLNQAGQAFTLVAQAGGLPAVTTNTFDVLAAGFMMLESPTSTGPASLRQLLLPNNGVAPTIVAIADFNGDSRDQLLMENTENHQLTLVSINDDGTTTAVSMSTALATTEVLGTGDFNGDGKADLICRNRTGGAAELIMLNGSAVLSTSSLPQLDFSAVTLVGTGRFDTDPHDDIVVRDIGTGTQSVRLWNGSTLGASLPLPSSLNGLTISEIVDLDQDGISDLLLYSSEPSLWTAIVGSSHSTELLIASSGPLAITAAELAGSRVAGSWKPRGIGSSNHAVILAATNGNWVQSSTPTITAAPRAGAGNVVHIIRQNDSRLDRYTLPLDPNDRVIGAGDFDGDGEAEILILDRTAMAHDVAALAATMQAYPTAQDSPVRSDDILDVGISAYPTSRRVDRLFNAARTATDDAAYPFYMGTGSVTVEQYVAFLNTARQQSSLNCFIAANGDVHYGTSGGVMLFDMSQNNNVTVPAPANKIMFNYGISYSLAGGYSFNPLYSDFPIMGVTWYGAVKYCNWLTLRRGLAGTELSFNEGTAAANWHPAHLSSAEWADGFSDAERLSWLMRYPHAVRLPMDQYSSTVGAYNEFHAAAAPANEPEATVGGGNYWNSQDYFDNGPTPTAYYAPNTYGLFNMSGNNWQWQLDSMVEGNNADRVLRGGSWFNYRAHTSTTYRFGIAPDSAYSDVGFRCAALTNCLFQAELATDSAFTTIVASSYNSSSDWNDLYSWSPSLSPSTQYHWRYRWHCPGLSSGWSAWQFGGAFATTSQVATTQSLAVAPGWSMVSLALEPSSAHYKHLFGMDSTVWVWDNTAQQYVRPFALNAHDGFWLYAPTLAASTARSTVSISGFTPASNIVTLRPSWNLIGPHNDNTPLPSSTSPVRGKIYGFGNNRYFEATDLDRGNAYWIFSSSTFLFNLGAQQ